MHSHYVKIIIHFISLLFRYFFNPLGTILFYIYIYFFIVLLYSFSFFEFKVIKSNEIHRLKARSIIKHSFLNIHSMHHVIFIII